MPVTTGPTVPDPFSPVELGSLKLRNHLVKAATFEGMAADNLVTDRLVSFHRAMAAGGGEDGHAGLFRRIP